MPEPTSSARGKMLNAETTPPVSGNTEAEAVAVAVALLLALAEDDAEGLAELLAEGNGVKGPPVVLDIGLAVGLASGPNSTSGRLLAWQPSGVSLG